MLFVFFVLDLSWETYQRASLQYAVAQGVRYAVTDQVMTALGYGQCKSVQTTVENNSWGVLGYLGDAALGYIQVKFYNTEGTKIADCAAPAGNSPGQQSDGNWPLIQVKVGGIKANPLMPNLGSGTMGALPLTAQSWDRMEPLPPGTNPPAM
jgi:hypothetical protein